MKFLIAETFPRSLAKLDGQSQALIKQAAFDFQMNPASPGFSFHKLDRVRDKNFWSFRVNQDLRIIVHRSGLFFCIRHSGRLSSVSARDRHVYREAREQENPWLRCTVRHDWSRKTRKRACC